MSAAGLSDTQKAGVVAGTGYSTTPSSSPLLVTSGPSRTDYNNNVTSMNTAVGNLAPPNTSTPVRGPDTTIDTNYFLKSGESLPTYTARIQAYNASKNAGTKTTTDSPDGKTVVTETDTKPPKDSAIDTSNDEIQYDDNGNPIIGANSGLDPTVIKTFNDSITNLNTGITTAKSALDAATATMANDPAALAAVAAIQAKYDQQIQLMQAKNTQLIGRANSSVGAFGGLGVMSQNFLSDEQDKASQRITDLIAQEQAMILKTQQAYKDGDVKALAAAQKAYDDANKAKLDAVGKLLTATNNQVKQLQAQQKIDAAAEKQTVTTDISKSTNLGGSIAKNLADAGVTDPAEMDKYIQEMAQTYGITNPDILKSAVVKAQQTQSKLDTSAANTESTMQSRATRDALAIQKANTPKVVKPSTKGSGTDGSFKYTQSDVDTYSSFLIKGGTGNGVTYAARGSDTFSDPNAYLFALNDWVSQGGTATGFAKKFPPKTWVNPDSYSKLPPSIRPATKAAPPA